MNTETFCTEHVILMILLLEHVLAFGGRINFNIFKKMVENVQVKVRAI